MLSRTGLPDDHRAGTGHGAPPAQARGRRTAADHRAARPAEDLPFEDATFDTVVSTLVLCGVGDQQRALRQIRRILRPGGRLLFIEHVRSDDPKLARHQDRMNWLNRLVVCCECNRPTVSSISHAGFAIDRLEHYAMPKAPRFVRPVVAGLALSPRS